MRFSLIFQLEKKEIPIDYRRKFISFLNKSYENYGKNRFDGSYSDNIEKPYTFAVYLGKAKFEKNTIKLDSNRVYLNFSTHDNEAGVYFYNSALAMKEEEFEIGLQNKMVLEQINLVKEKIIVEEKVVFRTLSPILIKKHSKERNRDWYYSFEEKNSIDILKENLKRQVISYFGDSHGSDVDEVKINLIRVTKIVINNFEVRIPANLGTFEVIGKSYLLDFFYKNGISSKKSAGFGMLDVVN